MEEINQPQTPLSNTPVEKSLITQQQQSVINKHPKNKLLFFGVGALGIIILIFGLGMLLFYKAFSSQQKLTVNNTPTVMNTPIPSHTTDSKTFEGDGYTIKYPTTLLLKETDSNNISFSFPYLSPTPTGITVGGESNYPTTITISKRQVTPNATLEQETSDYKNYNPQKIIIDGTEALFIPSISEYSEGSYAWVIKDTTLYTFNLSHGHSGEDFAQSQKVFKEVLDGFQFKNSDQTTNWKTYTNTTYEFSIKYPSDFAVEDKQKYIQVYKIGENIPKGPQEGGFEFPRLIIQPNSTLDGIDKATDIYKLTSEALQFDNSKITSNGYELGNNVVLRSTAKDKLYFNCYLANSAVELNVCNQILATFQPN